jgi:hypothetical protein
LAALQQPCARAERKPGPLERELGDVGEERGAVGAERGSDRQNVDGDASGEQRVRQVACEFLTVRSSDSEQDRPGCDREVVRRQDQRVAEPGRRGPVSLQL